MLDMVPRRGSLIVRYGLSPFVPRKESEVRRLTEVREHRFRVGAESQRCRRDDVKAFTNRIVSLIERELESLGDIVGVHVMHGCLSVIRKLHELAAGNAREHIGIEMPSGIHRVPTRSDDVPWMENQRPRSSAAGSVMQKLFNRGFLDAVIAERMAGGILCDRDSGRTTMDPHRAAMDQQR